MVALGSSRAAARTAVGFSLLGILAAALSLRLWNLHFGLPDWYHPDEPVKARAVSRIACGELHPGSFYHPSFLLYASAAMLRLTHLGNARPDEQAAVRAGRLTVALLGTATVLLCFIAGRSLGTWRTGLVAALLLAVAPLHVVCSHYLKEDVPVAFWALATYLAGLRLSRSGRLRHYLISGLLSGVAAGTKYVGFLFIGLIWLAHREWLAGRAEPQRMQPEAQRFLVLALLAAAAGFFLTTPYALLDIARFATGVAHSGGNALTGMAGIAVSPLPYLWTFHLQHSILPGLGAGATLLALAGFVLGIREPRAELRLLTAIAAALYVVFESSPYKPPPNYDRHLVALLPFLALLAATALDRLHRQLRFAGPRRAAWMAGAVLVLAAGPPACGTVRLTAAMAADTRAAARDWLVRHACSGERVLLEGALTVAGSALPSYVPALPPQCNATYVYSLERDRALLADADVVVATSFMYERFLRFPSASQGARRFYEDFFRAHQPVAELLPSYRSYGFHNPTIRIYRTGTRRPTGRAGAPMVHFFVRQPRLRAIASQGVSFSPGVAVAGCALGGSAATGANSGIVRPDLPQRTLDARPKRRSRATQSGRCANPICRFSSWGGRLSANAWQEAFSPVASATLPGFPSCLVARSNPTTTSRSESSPFAAAACRLWEHLRGGVGPTGRIWRAVVSW